MWYANLLPIGNQPKTEAELLNYFQEILRLLEAEHGIKFSHDVRKHHVNFFRLCLRYCWNPHSISSYIASHGYDLVYNVWTFRLDEIVRSEKQRVVKWDLVLGAYLNEKQEIIRFIFWKKEILMTKIMDRIKKRIREIDKVPCKQ
ncbi:MAG: hypothetical protein ACD_2C00244G0003 [uncultured bacterium (gcode 4)]|uniref:Uncharacterized protein n=1 Tax=uncultured bacterium (gcode 4) TaxID=1234023 RepID=K2GZT5_9BACT|nr:MAG: hypothetical protein ACD_2C00244G0003 [uncultured bacterium (gcode 4)]